MKKIKPVAFATLDELLALAPAGRDPDRKNVTVHHEQAKNAWLYEQVRK